MSAALPDQQTSPVRPGGEETAGGALPQQWGEAQLQQGHGHRQTGPGQGALHQRGPAHHGGPLRDAGQRPEVPHPPPVCPVQQEARGGGVHRDGPHLQDLHQRLQSGGRHLATGDPAGILQNAQSGLDNLYFCFHINIFFSIAINALLS